MRHPAVWALLGLLALVPGAIRAGAAVRNVWVEPAFLCPGQTVTVHYEARHSLNQDLYVFGVFSTNNSIELASDRGFMYDSLFNGTGACPAATLNPIETWRGMPNAPSSPTIVTYLPYSAVACVPAGYTTGLTVYVILRVKDGFGNATSPGDQTLALPIEVSCTKRQVSNQANLWYGQSNQVNLVIENDCGGTPTSTRSRTPTRTSTRTATPTATRTASPSATLTRTATPSATSSVTFSSTSTSSVTRTETPSRTVTSTSTPSPTGTWSVTESPTRTVTVTATPTQTVTFSPSPPFTSTNTPTRTESFTPSDTPSQTPTRTDTATRTATPTVTPSFTESFTRTATTTRSDTPTVSPSVTETNLYSPTFTYSFTHTPSATPTRTQTVTFSPSQTLTDSPTVTLSATPTASYTDTPTRTVTVTASYSYTVSPTITVSPTVTVTPVPVPYQLTVTVYNSAGERVRVVFEGSAQVLPTSIDLDKTVIRSGMDALNIDLLGALSNGSTFVSWMGQNDSGQTVKGGVYYLKLEYQDPFGTVTSFTKSVQVLEGKAGNRLDIYNSAGELVNRVDFNALSQTVTAFTLSKDQVVAAFKADGSAEDRIDLTLTLSDGSSLPFSWEGRNLDGKPLASGTYTVVLVSETSQGAQISSKTVTVLRGPDASLSWQPILGPNPAPAAGHPSWGRLLRISYPASELTGVTVALFNQAGERVAQDADRAGSGIAWLSYERTSAGVYFIEIRGRLASGAPYRKVLKAAILR